MSIAGLEFCTPGNGSTLKILDAALKAVKNAASADRTQIQGAPPGSGLLAARGHAVAYDLVAVELEVDSVLR
jgi:hypothetical protein